MRAISKSRERVIREAITQIFALQLRFGASLEEVSAKAQLSLRDASRSMFPDAFCRDDADVQRFGSLLRAWHRDARYLSKDGFPRHLSCEGKNGLRRLVNAHYPREQFNSFFAALRNTGLIRQDRNAKWFPTMKHAVFPSLTGELLAHFAEGVFRFIETMTRNVESRNKGDVLFERSSKVRKLPVSAAPAFRQFVNGQALAFLESVDDWLEGHVAEGSKSRQRKCAAGVYTFAFMDDSPKRQSRSLE